MIALNDVSKTFVRFMSGRLNLKVFSHNCLWILFVLYLPSPVTNVAKAALSNSSKMGGDLANPWWQDAVVYQIWPRSFRDSDGDGSGDFRGIKEKLPYLKSLGVNTLWLTPMFEAPSYHGYDFQEFYAVESDYGTMADFEDLVSAAKISGIKIIADLVINHISSESDWFKRSSRGESPYRDFFLWQGRIPEGPWGKPWATPNQPDDGFNKPFWVWFWNDQRQAFYYGAFSGSQPDLNLKNPEVLNEIDRIVDFWAQKGFSGVRLDAVRYGVEEGPYPLQSDSDGNFLFWREFQQRVKARLPNFYTVGEIWASTETIARYENQGQGIDQAFDFDFGYSLQRAFELASQSPSEGEGAAFASVMHEHFARKLRTGAPVGFFAPFLSNHDQMRFIQSIGNNINKMRISAVLLLTGIGTPFIYYGEEIGMTQIDGNPDDLFKRSPMQWHPGPNLGFSDPFEDGQTPRVWVDDPKWFPWRQGHQAWWSQWTTSEGFGRGRTVGEQLHDPTSLLNIYRRLIALRRLRPELRSVDPSSYRRIEAGPHLFAYERIAGPRHKTLVVINVSEKHSAEFTDPHEDGTKAQGFSKVVLKPGDIWVRPSMDGESTIITRPQFVR
jgi:glycosidase